MQAIEFLKSEHQTAKAEFGKVLQAAPGQRGALWQKLKPELQQHEQMEEECVYGPIAQDAGQKDAKLSSWKQHHHEEVSKVEKLIRETDQLDPQGDQWLSKVKEIHSSLEHHIQEEEGQIFPAISRVWDQAQLERAGEQLSQRKQQATKTRAA
jgi:iron-sulfur cluster repair protein YtfE (RIC family)